MNHIPQATRKLSFQLTLKVPLLVYMSVIEYGQGSLIGFNSDIVQKLT